MTKQTVDTIEIIKASNKHKVLVIDTKEGNTYCLSLELVLETVLKYIQKI